MKAARNRPQRESFLKTACLDLIHCENIQRGALTCFAPGADNARHVESAKEAYDDRKLTTH